ncbi:hypothetical protein OG897_35530 [Streptomyces sp. NBC_00237]|uniref:hypothetical protein n=1 Tax=Streptomyces sp. NBC_00237 TaxID=2975687 RepID=UPI00225535F9|nr:hypothetical protein [Streptomyces sp. NBC_00237]MCX5206703.1 hypothetical protein [Streptomyces sp. NBC_00237]
MTILRRHLSTGFTVLPTSTLEDARLSFRARGILAFLVAKPDTWAVRTDTIAKAGKEGRDAVRKAVQELKQFGYYRVVTEQLGDGTWHRVTEVYDTAQEWAAEEYDRLEAGRLTRKMARRWERDDTVTETEDGFSGVGEPVVGEPAVGGSGFIGSNQSQYPKGKTPPTPTAVAAGGSGEPGREADAEAVGGSSTAGADRAAGVGPAAASGGVVGPAGCVVHPLGAGKSCRACGTSPRAMREAEKQAERERFKDAAQEANERVLAEVRARPGGDDLSVRARELLEEMRGARKRAGTGGSGIEHDG